MSWLIRNRGQKFATILALTGATLASATGAVAGQLTGVWKLSLIHI